MLGFIGPIGGFAIGLASGGLCYWASTLLKLRLGYDDSLDVFGVHGVGGFVGTLMVALFASGAWGGNQGDLAIGRQLGVQLGAAVAAVVYTALVTFALLKAVNAVVSLRVDDTDERQGLDLALHNEAGYRL